MEPLIDRFPKVLQETEFTCGAAVAQAILAYYGVRGVSEAEIATILHTDIEDGTHPGHLAGFFVNMGFDVRAGRMTVAEVEQWVDQGVPVILDLQAWAEDPSVDYSVSLDNGHYVVAIGYDPYSLIVEDPYMVGGTRGYIPRKELDERWHGQAYNRRIDHFGIAVLSRNRREIVARIARTWASTRG